VKQSAATWVLGGRRVPPGLVLLLAVGWSFGALAWLLLAFDGADVAWTRWLRLASAAAGLLLACYFWVVYARVRRNRP
jgi:Na+/proline symporter